MEGSFVGEFVELVGDGVYGGDWVFFWCCCLVIRVNLVIVFKLVG